MTIEELYKWAVKNDVEDAIIMTYDMYGDIGECGEPYCQTRYNGTTEVII